MRNLLLGDSGEQDSDDDNDQDTAGAADDFFMSEADAEEGDEGGDVEGEMSMTYVPTDNKKSKSGLDDNVNAVRSHFYCDGTRC